AQPINTPVLATTKPVQVKNKILVPTVVANNVQKSPKTATSSQKVNTNIPQTASVYEGSQQPVFARLGTMIYNGLHGLWAFLQKFF
ncbi:MAG: hypothetical protein Q8P23_00625, partial [bacterium]|nr:hypothetical protein [bacterium]